MLSWQHDCWQHDCWQHYCWQHDCWQHDCWQHYCWQHYCWQHDCWHPTWHSPIKSLHHIVVYDMSYSSCDIVTICLTVTICRTVTYHMSYCCWYNYPERLFVTPPPPSSILHLSYIFHYILNIIYYILYIIILKWYLSLREQYL